MLDKYCPKGVNVYFDNVGGSITDSVINKLANYARVAVCGVISQYNLTAPEPGLRTHRSMLTNQATTEGFLVFQFAQKYHIAIERIAKWIKEGKIVYKEDIVTGLENAPEAFIGIELPSQIDKEGEVILIFGAGKRSTKNVVSSVQPLAFCAVIV